MVLRYQVEENIANWQQGFSTYMAIMLVRFPELGSEMAVYHNRINVAQTTLGGNGWNGYDKEFRKAKAQDPDLRWSQTDMFIHLRHLATAPNDNSKVKGQDSGHFLYCATNKYMEQDTSSLIVT